MKIQICLRFGQTLFVTLVYPGTALQDTTASLSMGGCIDDSSSRWLSHWNINEDNVQSHRGQGAVTMKLWTLTQQ